jgi:hypothetical protein
LCMVGENVKWHSHCGKHCGCSSKKSNIELQYNPAISLWGVHPKRTENRDLKRYGDTYIHDSIIAIAKK